MKSLFGLKEPALFFDVMVHFGTLVAVIWVFREDLIKLIRIFFTLIPRVSSRNQLHNSLPGDNEAKLIGLIVIATLPTALIGFFFKDLFEKLFSSVFAVGVSLILTGTLLLLTRLAPSRQKTINDMTIVDALVIGFAQALAITPGISRSGTTISIALFLGIDRELAGRFSFLIFIPAVFGAIIINHQVPEELVTKLYFCNIIAATVTAAIIGCLALKILLRFVRQGRLYFFSPYLYGVGLIAILFALFQ